MEDTVLSIVANTMASTMHLVVQQLLPLDLDEGLTSVLSQEQGGLVPWTCTCVSIGSSDTIVDSFVEDEERNQTNRVVGGQESDIQSTETNLRMWDLSWMDGGVHPRELPFLPGNAW